MNYTQQQIQQRSLLFSMKQVQTLFERPMYV
jgi:hypothetical protein